MVAVKMGGPMIPYTYGRNATTYEHDAASYACTSYGSANDAPADYADAAGRLRPLLQLCVRMLVDVNVLVTV